MVAPDDICHTEQEKKPTLEISKDSTDITISMNNLKLDLDDISEKEVTTIKYDENEQSSNVVRSMVESYTISNSNFENDEYHKDQNTSDEEDYEDSENDSSFGDEYFNFDNNFGMEYTIYVPKEHEAKCIEPEPAKSQIAFEKFVSAKKAHESHKFIRDVPEPCTESEFIRAYKRDVKILQEGLPDGIFVKVYEDRMDLLSALIMGPAGTPYEGGLFAFDIKLPKKYPHVAPKFYFISFTKDRLNPNLYTTCGKVCLSILNTWPGGDKCERWSSQSSLLQVLVSIQGLVLVPEPYYNEAGYSRHPGNPVVEKYSKDYTQNVVLLLLQAMAAKMKSPPLPWTEECLFVLKEEIPRMISRLEEWIRNSNFAKHSSAQQGFKADVGLPEYPLLPIDRIDEIKTAIAYLKTQYVKSFGNWH